MTHSGGKPHTKVGDRGQRYEVHCTDCNGDDLRIGWTNDPTGGGLVEAVNLHPSWHTPVVIDRHAEPAKP